MFSGGQSGVLFGGAATQNSQTSFFGSSQPTATNGTTCAYQAVDSTDSLQKNNTTVNINTKLHCLTAMKTYEGKSIEELRWEDYQANRISSSKATSGTMFGTQPTMFTSSYNPYGVSQTTQNSLFTGNNQQSGSFGTTTAASPAFSSFANQSKPTSLFSSNNTGAVNKPLFSSVQPTQQTSSIFGSSTTPAASSLFNSPQQQQQSNSFFTSTSQQQPVQSQQSSIFGNTTGSFGFQTPQTGTLFGANSNTQSKPFGLSGNTVFSAVSSAPQSSGGIFGQPQQQTNTAFGNTAAKTTALFSSQPLTASVGGGIFSNNNTSTITSSSIISGQQSSLFSQQSKAAFGTSIFGVGNTAVATAPKPSLFSNVGTPFSTQQTAAVTPFGSFGTVSQQQQQQQLQQQSQLFSISGNQGDLLLQQQQQQQQKILSLVSNRPYGVNKLFLGQSIINNSTPTTTTASQVTNGNNNITNITSMAIKKNDGVQIQMLQRRRILDQKTKILPNNLHRVFSGFDHQDHDGDSSSSIRSDNNQRLFVTRRENWKYIPPNAFDKPRKSIISNTRSIINNGAINNGGIDSSLISTTAAAAEGIERENGDSRKYGNSSSLIDDRQLSREVSSPFPSASVFFRKPDSNKHSTPLINNNNSSFPKSFQNDTFSPIRHVNKVTNCKEEIVDGDEDVDNDVDDARLGASSFDNHNLLVSRKDNDDNNREGNVTYNGHGNNREKCRVKLTREGYYTAPTEEVLDTLVTVSEEDGEYECWVENFIVGRQSYGSIRFPGLTNVYGLDLDRLVNIELKEVSVYPEDVDEDDNGGCGNNNIKPDVGEGLNKVAQVVLQKVWPVDKSSREIIVDEERLAAMKFLEKLRRATDKMGARFISYTAQKGVWVFEVDHFSKYRFDDDDDEDEEEEDGENKSKSKIDMNLNSKKDLKIHSVDVVSAEADSMTDLLEKGKQDVPTVKRFYNNNNNNSNSRIIKHMKQNLYPLQESDTEEYRNDGLFKSWNNNTSSGHVPLYHQKEEPQAKRFETMEMGRSILDSSLNNKNSLVLRENMWENFHDDSCPIKPIEAQPIASTKIVFTNNKVSRPLKIPHKYRDIRSMKMPYLPLKLNSYFDVELNEIHKKYPFDIGICQGNRFRVGFHISSNEVCAGLTFIRKDYSNHSDANLSSFGIRHDNVVLNAINLVKIEYSFSEYQEKLLQSAFEESTCITDNEGECPFWKPLENLTVLKSYMNVHCGGNKDNSFEVSVFSRIVSLCNALWANIGSDIFQTPNILKNIERKQSLSKWIRMQCRNDLTKKVESVLRSSTKLDIAMCNDMILEALCSGEIQLACKLATLTKQHRMALLISQSAGCLESRYIVREQLNRWSLDKTDQNITDNVMCIYVLLSGQSSHVTSDGSIITPLKHVKWYQAMGCYIWFIQPYTDSIKSSLDLYQEDFKTDSDIPAPFPFSCSDTREDEDHPFYDCCYHLLNFYGDSLYDLDVTVNPPTISKDNKHKLSTDWSPSWHLSNILNSLGHRVHSHDKLCNEWAAQLEKGGQWHWATFIILHITNLKHRQSSLRNLVIRNVIGSQSFSEKEIFVNEKLGVSKKLIHEAKAIFCKNVNDSEMEAFHWFMSGKYEKSHEIYVDEILATMVLNDEFDKMWEILAQFTEAGVNNLLPNWSSGGAVYLHYLSVKRSLRTMTMANKILSHHHSVLVAGEEARVLPDVVLEERDDFDLQLRKLKVQVVKLNELVNCGGFKTNSDKKRICKEQIGTVCSKFLLSCSNNNEIF